MASNSDCPHHTPFEVNDRSSTHHLVGFLSPPEDVESESAAESTRDDGPSLLVADVGCLTDTQREVLEVAYEVGHYDTEGREKEEDIERVAAELGVPKPVASERLQSAKGTLVKNVFGNDR